MESNLSLGNLDLNYSHEVDEYFERFEIWCITLNDLDEKKKAAYFLNAIGKSAYSTVKTLTFPDSPISLSYKELKEKILKHVKPMNFEASERAKFHSLVRKPNQSVRSYILELQSQAGRCNFAERLHESLRDRLIAGINQSSLKLKLLSMTEPTYESVKSQCERFEDLLNETSDQSSTVLYQRVKHTRPHRPLHHVSEPNQSTAQNFKPVNQFSPCVSKDTTTSRSGPCFSCGKLHLRSTCRFRNAQCHTCGRLGHIKSVCRQSKPCNLTESVSSDSDNSSIDPISDTLNTLSLCTTAPTHERIYIVLSNANGYKHEFIVDTGSSESIISQSTLKYLDPTAPILPTSKTILGVTGHSLPILGVSRVKLSDKYDAVHELSFIICESSVSILGLKSLSQMHVSLNLLPESIDQSRLRDLIHLCASAVGFRLSAYSHG